MVTSQPTKIHSDLVVPQQVLWKSWAHLFPVGKASFPIVHFSWWHWMPSALKIHELLVINPAYIKYHCSLSWSSFVLCFKCECSHFQKEWIFSFICCYLACLLCKSCDTKSTPTTVTRCSTKVLFVDQKWNDLSTVKLLYIVSSHDKINCWKCAFSFHPLIGAVTHSLWVWNPDG